MASACDFPDELLTKPLGYVGLTGLDAQYNAMHKSIWDTFSINRRQDKVLNIKLLPGDAEFPVKKTKQVNWHKSVFRTKLNIYDRESLWKNVNGF